MATCTRRSLVLTAALALLGAGTAAAQGGNPLDRDPDRNPLEARLEEQSSHEPRGNPLDPDPAWSGAFVDETHRVLVVIVPAAAAQDRLEGVLVMDPRSDEEVYPMRGTVAGDELRGSFGRDRKFDFTGRLLGPNLLRLDSGRATLLLRRERKAGAVARLRREVDKVVNPPPVPPEDRLVGALRTLSVAQSLFREGDKEGDGQLDYGTLKELEATQLIDGVLGSGQLHGYRVEVYVSRTQPEFLWMAVASPLAPGGKHLVVNHAGVIYESSEPVPFNDECHPPASCVPYQQRRR